ncbi:GNAT family N-acetyltransferase [Bartonella tamiae]|uniref:N-acetyltransferase domain-containing protein n=1 Tax=Bartonella tamiae Th239 TaxID=1094558 RepID=J0R0H7_9HYPH|nr:GNAT family N-acetyltransferase [Bartonella tamiae]EJF89009.1 hypothetical protein ME5_01560 [Bartonella tamiae Th239]EJF94741.1 hypothetical protein MEG_00322 [Bartonella tamiae Th307]
MIKNSNYLQARVTFLEMYKRPQNSVTPPLHQRLAIMKAFDVPVHFYRYLYELIGKQHHWIVRHRMDDQTLKNLLSSTLTQIHILYVDGCPAGFAEINLRQMPERGEIVYFGLVPDYQGRRLSKFFLQEIILSLWDENPEKIIIQTNTLDNPRALQLYQKCGFEPIDFKDVLIEKWK